MDSHDITHLWVIAENWWFAHQTVSQQIVAVVEGYLDHHGTEQASVQIRGLIDRDQNSTKNDQQLKRT